MKNETDLTENLLVDFKNNNDSINKNIEDLNEYGETILKKTTQEILNLKK